LIHTLSSSTSVSVVQSQVEVENVSTKVHQIVNSHTENVLSSIFSEYTKSAESTLPSESKSFVVAVSTVGQALSTTSQAINV